MINLAPPGCLLRYVVTSYTTPLITVQQSSILLCDLTSLNSKVVVVVVVVVRVVVVVVLVMI